VGLHAGARDILTGRCKIGARGSVSPEGDEVPTQRLLTVDEGDALTHEPPLDGALEALFLRIEQGDDTAMDALLRDDAAADLRRLVARLARGVSGLSSCDLFEDVAVHVLLALRRGAYTPRGGRGARAWLRTVARRAAIDELRRWATPPVPYDEDPWLDREADVDPGPERTVEQRELEKAILARATQILSERQLAVVRADLAAGGSAPAREIAERLETTPANVYVIRVRARRTLQADDVVRRLLDLSGAAARAASPAGERPPPSVSQAEPPEAPPERGVRVS